MLVSGEASIFTENNNIKSIISAVIYVSYNSIVLIPILITLNKYANSTKNQIIISIFCVIFFLIMGFAINHIIENIENISNIEIPLLYIAKQLGSVFTIMYGATIILAMLTSAVSAGLGFLENISKNKKVKWIVILILNITAIVLSGFGFSNLVAILYPIFGILGLVQMFFIFIS